MLVVYTGKLFVLGGNKMMSDALHLLNVERSKVFEIHDISSSEIFRIVLCKMDVLNEKKECRYWISPPDFKSM